VVLRGQHDEDGPVTQHGYPFQQPGGRGVLSPSAPGFQPGWSRPAPARAEPVPLAGLADRVLARLIDWTVLGTVMVTVLVAVGYLIARPIWQSIEFTDEGTIPGSEGGALAALVLVAAGSFLICLTIHYVYEVELARHTGQTLGKRLVRVRVVVLGPAQPMDRATMVRRWLVLGPMAALVPILGLVDGAWQLWDRPYRQCLHDKLAGTVVAKR
jgi:uncharacterized RDD family membrane protein YckC